MAIGRRSHELLQDMVLIDSNTKVTGFLEKEIPDRIVHSVMARRGGKIAPASFQWTSNGDWNARLHLNAVFQAANHVRV